MTQTQAPGLGATQDEHLEALARPVPVNDGIAQRVLLDVPPGDSGLRWLWPDERVEELDPRLERVASPAILRAWWPT